MAFWRCHQKVTVQARDIFPSRFVSRYSHVTSSWPEVGMEEVTTDPAPSQAGSVCLHTPVPFTGWTLMSLVTLEATHWKCQGSTEQDLKWPSGPQSQVPTPTQSCSPPPTNVEPLWVLFMLENRSLMCLFIKRYALSEHSGRSTYQKTKNSFQWTCLRHFESITSSPSQTIRWLQPTV